MKRSRKMAMRSASVELIIARDQAQTTTRVVTREYDPEQRQKMRVVSADGEQSTAQTHGLEHGAGQ